MDNHIASLLPVQYRQIGGSEVNAFSGRDLHSFLGVGKDFSAWMPEMIEAFNFVEGQDFEVFSNFGENPQGGRPRKEYMLSLPMAKELAMVQRTEKGKEARLYFIECERKAHQPQKLLTTAEIVLAQAQLAVEHERRLSTVESALEMLRAETDEATKDLQALPHPEYQAAELRDRAAVSRVVRAYVVRTRVPFRDAWNQLYIEFRDRYHVDLKRRAENAGIKPLDVAEQLGDEVMSHLYSLACHLFVEVA